MKQLTCQGVPVVFGPIDEMNLSDYFPAGDGLKVLIVVDENTLEHCLPDFIASQEIFGQAEIIQLPSGEENKTIEMCLEVYKTLTELQFGRKDLIVALGGGVICDMVGFIAGTYKRGIPFVSFPTTLLSMVDASVGGKTGIDFGGLKNQIGLFNNAVYTGIDVQFLQTLPPKEIQSGLAEMIKHGLIQDTVPFSEIEAVITSGENLSDQLLWNSVRIKAEVVDQDPKEKGLRKILNFGHTVGHAIESFCLEKDKMTHGLAIAHGMLVEARIAVDKGLLKDEEFLRIEKLLRKFPLEEFAEEDYSSLLSLMDNDKKNEGGKIKMSSLTEIGAATYDIEVSKDEIISGLNCLRIN